MELKEYRVYVAYSDEVTSEKISSWNKHEVLPQEALDFIEQAEFYGNVFTLIGFQNALNFNEINIENEYIFITNKY